MTLQQRAEALRDQFRTDLRRRHPALRGRALMPSPKAAQPVPTPATGKRIIIGVDAAGLPFALPDSSRALHTHIMGVPKSGKSFGMFHQIRQDILNGAAVIVLDPHGAHDQSIFNLTIRWLVTSGIARKRRVHVFDPSAPRTCGYNPLHCPAGVDPSVIANNALEAVSRGWGDEDTQEKPTLRRGLRSIFIAMAELNLTLLEASLFLLPDDPYGARAWALRTLKDERARTYLDRLDRLAANPRMAQSFEVEVIGILNRLEEFTSSKAIRRVLGQSKGIDLREVMDNGEVLLVNLAGGDQFYEAEGDLLGRLFLRGVLFEGKRRKNLQPAMLWCDEGHRYLSGDIPNALEELRKFNIAITLGHQNLSQLGLPGDRVREALLKVPQNRLLFRLNSMEEATAMAPEVVKLNLETPVAALTKPAVISYEMRLMKSKSTGGGLTNASSNSRTATRTDSNAIGKSIGGSRGGSTSKATARTTTHGTSRSVADGVANTTGVTHSRSSSHATSNTQSESKSYGRASGNGGSHSDQRGWSIDQSRGDAYSKTTDPTSNAWPDRTQSSSSSNGRSGGSSDSDNWSEGQNWSLTSGSAHSETDTETEGVAETESHTTSRVVTKVENESESVAETIGTSESRSRNWAQTRQEGTSTATGTTTGTSVANTTNWSDEVSEALAPVLEERPGSVHSRENVVHLAAEVINHLPTGTAIVKALINGRIESALVRLPLVADAKEKYEGYARSYLLEHSPLAVPSSEADQIIHERHEWLKAEGANLAGLPEEPDTPAGFRIPAPKRRRGK
jgi:hypothetical protein